MRLLKKFHIALGMAELLALEPLRKLLVRLDQEYARMFELAPDSETPFSDWCDCVRAEVNAVTADICVQAHDLDQQ